MPRVELSMSDIADAMGASMTQARGAVHALLRAGSVAMCVGGYYSAVASN